MTETRNKKVQEYSKELWEEEIEMYKKRAEELYDFKLTKSSNKNKTSVNSYKGIPSQEFIDKFLESFEDSSDEAMSRRIGRISADMSDITEKVLEFSDLIIKFLDEKAGNHGKIGDILIDLDTLMAELNFHSNDFMSNVQPLADRLYEKKKVSK